MQKPLFDFSQPAVDERGYFLPHIQDRLNYLTRWIPIQGTGSPEGVVEALQYSTYEDTSGSAGSTHYWKKEADIAGDTTMGWQLI